MPALLFVFQNTLTQSFEYFSEDDQLEIEKLESDWLLFWSKEGEGIVHTTWLKKYSEYLLNENLEEEEKLEEGITQIGQESEVSVKDNSTEISYEPDDYSCQWQDLWNQHYTKTYEKTYQLYLQVYNNQYNFYKLQSQEDLLEDSSSHLLDEDNDLDPEYTDHTEELQALGLPTSFGGLNRKYHKSRLQDLSCDSLSEQESEEYYDMAPVQKPDPQKPTLKKKKIKNRKLKRMPKIVAEDKSIQSYWFKRFSLFSLFDEGIKLDRESWFSVTPEKVAMHMAERLKCGTIIDAFCGSGGNSIQFARTCRRVIAIDIDPEKIINARHNAGIYGVADKIDFIIGDFLQLSESLKGDVVFLSPPWGGPKYISQKEYNIEESLKPLGASELAEKSRLISENIAFFLPKNSNPKQIAKVAGVGNRVEVEHNYLNTRLVGLTAIYGDWLIDKKNL